MSQEEPGIVVVERGIDKAELRRLVNLYFGDMVKIVVDVRRRVAAVGGELHADAKLLDPSDTERLRACYERILALVDLTVQVQDRPSRACIPQRRAPCYSPGAWWSTKR